MRFLRDERGADLVEYAVIIILIVVAAYAGIRAFGLDVANLFEWLGSLF